MAHRHKFGPKRVDTDNTYFRSHSSDYVAANPMKKYIVFGVIALALIAAGTVYADGGFVDAYTIDPASLPEGVTSWVIDGRVFVRDDLSGNVWEWCQGECDGKTCPVPSGTPVTPESTPTDTPDGTPTTVPSSTPTDVSENKGACNRGVGNYDEDCDPGNSSGQGQGGGRNAGEDRNEDKGPPGKGNGNNR